MTRASPDADSTELEKPKRRGLGATEGLGRRGESSFTFWDDLSAQY